MAIQVTKEWFIDITDDFEKRVENQKLIFWRTGITVILAAFRLPETTGKLELLNQIQDKIPEDSLETFVSTKGEIVGLGYTHIHKESGEKNRLALVTFTASDSSCLQSAFYLDKPDDLAWAIKTWENIIFHPDSEIDPLKNGQV
jgi:hypothetical protein